MATVIQAIVIDKKTKKSIHSFSTLEDALEYVSGNYHSLGIVYYDDKYNEHIYRGNRD
jgi:hypothetical protein